MPSCDAENLLIKRGYGILRNHLIYLAVPAGFEPAFSP